MTALIRKAEVTDAAQIANVHVRSWEAAYVKIIPNDTISEKNALRPALWSKLLEEADEDFKFAVCDNEIIAGLMIIGKSRDEDANETTFEVDAIYLLPEYFGKGFGKSAMEYAVKFASENGYRKVTLWVLEENHRARRFYEKCGFAFDGTKKQVVIGKSLTELRYAIALQ